MSIQGENASCSPHEVVLGEKVRGENVSKLRDFPADEEWEQ